MSSIPISNKNLDERACLYGGNETAVNAVRAASATTTVTLVGTIVDGDVLAYIRNTSDRIITIM